MALLSLGSNYQPSELVPSWGQTFLNFLELNPTNVLGVLKFYTSPKINHLGQNWWQPNLDSTRLIKTSLWAPSWALYVMLCHWWSASFWIFQSQRRKAKFFIILANPYTDKFLRAQMHSAMSQQLLSITTSLNHNRKTKMAWPIGCFTKTLF